MEAMATGAWGTAPRAALVSAEVTTTLVVAHAAAGGMLPSAGWIAVMAFAVFAAGLPVLRGSARAVVVLPALLAAQIGLHLWLGALTAAAHSGHAHGAATGDLHVGWPMLAAHLLGAAVTALSWHVRRRTVERLLVWGTATVAALTPPRALPASARRVRPAARRPLSLAPRRGPPVALRAV